jgi:hypothetical protein
MQFWSINVDPKYLNFATFSKDLLASWQLPMLEFTAEKKEHKSGESVLER